MRAEDAAYIAGYFDGEGSVTRANTNDRPSLVRIVLSQRDRQALERIAEDLGFGRVHTRADGTSDLQIRRAEDVAAFVRLVYPFVRQKRAQLRIAYRIARLISRGGAAARRGDLLVELAEANLRGRSRAIANRHGSRAA